MIVIHTEALGIRRQLLSVVINFFKDFVNSTTFITKPDPQDIPKTIEERIKYEPVADEDFTKAMQPLSHEQLSNILKHEAAWKAVIASKTPTLIIEDDAFILPESAEALKNMPQELPQGIAFLGITQPNIPPTSPQTFHQSNFKIIPNKEAYIVTPDIANVLLKNSQTIRFTTRYYLSWVVYNSLIKAYHLTSRITADASKLGFIPSSINTSNLLILNHEYMEMWNLYTNIKSDDELKAQLPKITEYYKRTEHIQSGDIMHLYGVILYRCGKKHEGRDLLLNAIDQLQRKGGLVNARSDILNNTIQIYQTLQEDLSDLSKKPSRYAAL